MTQRIGLAVYAIGLGGTPLDDRKQMQRRGTRACVDTAVPIRHEVPTHA